MDAMQSNQTEHGHRELGKPGYPGFFAFGHWQGGWRRSARVTV